MSSILHVRKLEESLLGFNGGQSELEARLVWCRFLAALPLGAAVLLGRGRALTPLLLFPVCVLRLLASTTSGEEDEEPGDILRFESERAPEPQPVAARKRSAR